MECIALVCSQCFGSVPSPCWSHTLLHGPTRCFMVCGGLLWRCLAAGSALICRPLVSCAHIKEKEYGLACTWRTFMMRLIDHCWGDHFGVWFLVSTRYQRFKWSTRYLLWEDLLEKGDQYFLLPLLFQLSLTFFHTNICITLQLVFSEMAGTVKNVTPNKKWTPSQVFEDKARSIFDLFVIFISQSM